MYGEASSIYGLPLHWVSNGNNRCAETFVLILSSVVRVVIAGYPRLARD